MTFDYRRAEKTAQRLLAKFGQSAILHRPGAKTGPEYDPTIGPPIEVPCTVAILDYSIRERDGTLIKATDKKAYISTEGLTEPVSVEDTLSIAGIDHTIVRVDPLTPAGQTVMFTAQVRT